MYRDILIFIQREKAKKLKNSGFVTKYHTKKDEAAIKNWSNKICKKIFYKFLDAVLIGDLEDLSTGSCCFCLKHGFSNMNGGTCGKCEYGKIHGHCSDELDYGCDYYHLEDLEDLEEDGEAVSDYSKLLIEEYHLDMPVSEILDNEFYKQIVIKIFKKFLREEV